MERLPLVSIITPSLNQGRSIEETINSVLDQDYPHIEYIVIDGGSTDNTLEVLKKYDKRIAWTSEPDNGQADAVNKGIRRSTGTIVSFLNSDDTYCERAVSGAVDYLLANPEVSWIYGEGYEIDIDGRILRRFPFTQEMNLKKLISVADYILQPTVFIRREAVMDAGLLDTGLHWCFDWDLWIRPAKKYRGDYVPLFLANSRVYRDTKTSAGGRERLREILSVMRRHGGGKYPIGFFSYFQATCEASIEADYPLLHGIIYSSSIRCFP